MIKIPATGEGLAAITATLAQGISVNVTLIFSLTRYRAVMQAFVDGLQAAQANGLDISKIHSVASFFVSRIDSAVDPLLEQNGSEEALNLRGKIGLANSHAAYAEFKKFFAANSIWPKLTAAGAHHQRPLWASTGVKNPTYSPTLYVDSLAYPDTVNTMPPATLDALSASTDHALYPTDADLEQATANLQKLADLDISLSQIAVQLENEGVEKFIASWEDLLKNIYDKLR
jgi:transaldolase